MIAVLRCHGRFLVCGLLSLITEVSWAEFLEWPNAPERAIIADAPVAPELG